MSKREKRLLKARQNPRDFTLNELSQLLDDYGFSLKRVTGSHHIFEYTLKGEKLKFIVPYRRPLKPIYVRDAIAIIDAIIESSDTPEESDES